jgi:focal adhesion kinase 1
VVQETQAFLEAKLRKQQQESEMDSKWLHQEEHNLKKRLSLAAPIDDNGGEGGGNAPLSGSYHQQQHHVSQSPKYSPSNSVSGPQSLMDSNDGLRPRTPAGSNPETMALQNSSKERSITASSNGDDKSMGFGKVS